MMYVLLLPCTDEKKQKALYDALEAALMDWQKEVWKARKEYDLEVARREQEELDRYERDRIADEIQQQTLLRELHNAPVENVGSGLSAEDERQLGLHDSGKCMHFIPSAR
jgi:hypothetical protein